MTAIAFRDRIIASDRLVRSGNTRCGYSTKIRKHKNCVSLGAGPLPIVEKFHDWVTSGMNADDMPQIDGTGDNRAECATISKDGVVTEYLDGQAFVLDAEYFAWGSGMDFALGSMHAGSDAGNSILSAICFDTGSGGSVDLICLDDLDE